jgi:hypothetical protein
MFKKLKELFAGREYKIAIYIPDRAWGYGHPLTYERDSKKFKKELENQHKQKLHLDNIGPGADWPAYVAWVSVPGVSAAALYIFFKGKDIKENIEAWKEIFESIRPFLIHQPVVNRDGAAVIAIERISLMTGQIKENIRLIGYEPIHMGEDLNQYDFAALLSIQEAPQALYLGVLFHAFQIEVDGRRFGVLIYREDVRVRELAAAVSN